MATTPRKPLKIKTERDENVKDWRSAPTTSSPPKSRGISPTKFHQKRHRAPKVVEELHLSIEESLDFQQKREHATKLAMQRAAFKQLTELKSWPLQDMAMEHYQQLKNGKSPKNNTLTGSDSPLSESSSCDSSFLEEPKRCMRQLESSPRKSALKQHYLDEFELATSTTTQANENPEQQQQPLWSRQPRIFATEKAQGKRKYLVGHFGRIQDLYWRKMNPKHLYEVIQEQTPCRLYFDLEFSKVYNPNVDAEKLLEAFSRGAGSGNSTRTKSTFETKCHLRFGFDQRFQIFEALDCPFGRFISGCTSCRAFCQTTSGTIGRGNGNWSTSKCSTHTCPTLVCADQRRCQDVVFY
jgi:hypothetical protein